MEICGRAEGEGTVVSKKESLRGGRYQNWRKLINIFTMLMLMDRSAFSGHTSSNYNGDGKGNWWDMKQAINNHGGWKISRNN